VFYDIFDVKTLCLCANSRKLLIVFNWEKWQIVMGWTSFYMGNLLRYIGIWIVIYCVLDKLSFWEFLVNPFTVLIMIDFTLILTKLVDNIKNIGDVNALPKK